MDSPLVKNISLALDDKPSVFALRDESRKILKQIGFPTKKTETWKYTNIQSLIEKDLQIDIPIFSDVADEHNRIVGVKTFYKTVQGLYNLALFNQRIGLRIVIHKQTYKRLPQLADYIYHNFPFVSQVAFMQMETTGNAVANLNELWIDPYDYHEELKQAVLLLANRGIRTFIFNAQLCVLPSELREFAIASISDWKDEYLPECDGCKLRERCGGLFASNQKHHSSHINPYLEDITVSTCV